MLVFPQAEAEPQSRGLIEQPVVLKRVNPVYTEEARAAKIEGVVVMEILIRKDGTVSAQRILRGLGYGLDESARTAIEQWRFRPQRENGEPVDATITFEMI
jgi:protein TonB